ncbi:MAG: acetyl-CoA decarbonylase/synthase complex subunit alpha/beta, partial [Thermoplasmata archaeon]
MRKEKNSEELSALLRAGCEGAKKALELAQNSVSEIIKTKGDTKFGYPETAYGLPILYAFEGVEVKKISDVFPILEKMKNDMLRIMSKDVLEIPDGLVAGKATLYAAEVIEALKYIEIEKPYEPPITGFIPDAVLRRLGVSLVDDTIPGVAVFLGKATDVKGLVQMIRECQEKGMLIMAAMDVIEQLKKENIGLGIERMLYPLGDLTAVVHAVNFAVRAGLAFGGIKKGQEEEMLTYLKKRVKAFVVHLGVVNELVAGAALGALYCGIPIITDCNLPELENLVVVEKDATKVISTAIDLKGIKIKLTKVPIPVPYGPAFEGEIIRKKDAYLEAGGTRSISFELVRMNENAIDGKIDFIGKDVDEIDAGSTIPLAIIVDVAGKKMEKDFESVIERRIHIFLNYAEGLWHAGQRNLNWIRMSKSAVEKGLKLKHIGDILISKFRNEFSGIISRVQVTIITDEEEVKRRLPEALAIYSERDKRLSGLTDESVSTYYTCLLCQSFAPDHVCIVTPERLGLCGAINWLDAKASYEITPTGPNQPVEKSVIIDEKKGSFRGINEAVKEKSHGKIDEINLYSMMEKPMTSCGCFECIVAFVPECNGVMIVNREYSGDTPTGMKFSTLAGTVGGGVQVPGFMGIGRQYITSRKFISADGGLGRIVWMP